MAAPAPVNPPPKRRIIFEPSVWTVLLLLVFGGGLLFAIILKPSSLERFSDQEYARGIITFIISVSTIGIAFVLIYQAFFSVDATDDRFRRGREVFTGLMGVLGTIVGFYFGAAADEREQMIIAEIEVDDSEVRTYISGGDPPYRYVVVVGADTVARGESSNGWVKASLERGLEPGDTITVDVTDSESKHGERTFSVPGQTPPAPGGEAVDSPTRQ